MSEGPYRDLGEGFARLTGVEGVRRAPSPLETVEDALLELVRNAADAGAENVYVAAALRARRYREVVVLDDGRGVPESHRELIFEPGVTTRHLAPSRLAGASAGATHGAGLSLHHIREAALCAELLSTNSPTSIKAVFDTERLPERSLQSGGPRRGSRSNLRAILGNLASSPGAPEVYYGSPASVLARLVERRVIPEKLTTAERESWCRRKLGVELSRRTLQRMARGEIPPAPRVERRDREEMGGASPLQEERVGLPSFGGRLELDGRDLAEIRGVIERAARESYLEVEGLEFESREGEITLRARVYEAEEEYDG